MKVFIALKSAVWWFWDTDIKKTTSHCVVFVLQAFIQLGPQAIFPTQVEQKHFLKGNDKVDGDDDGRWLRWWWHRQKGWKKILQPVVAENKTECQKFNLGHSLTWAQVWPKLI